MVISYSVLNDFTGLANAALTDWKLTVNKAIKPMNKKGITKKAQ